MKISEFLAVQTRAAERSATASYVSLPVADHRRLVQLASGERPADMEDDRAGQKPAK